MDKGATEVHVSLTNVHVHVHVRFPMFCISRISRLT